MVDTIDFVGVINLESHPQVHGGPFALGPVTMAFESLFAASRPRQLFSTRSESVQIALSQELDGNVYEEEVFQHFLAVERMRAERSERPLLLLLVGLRRCPKMGADVPRAVSPALLTGLGVCVREVDFVGWYRQGRVAAAVLTQGLDLPDEDAPSRIVERVTRILSERLPHGVAERLRVRVVRLVP